MDNYERNIVIDDVSGDNINIHIKICKGRL